MNYTQMCMMSRAWHAAQAFPPPPEKARQINMAVTWLLCRGNIFRVPLSTLYRHRQSGVWGLTQFEAKCKTLFIHRMKLLGKQAGTITAEWMNSWALNKHSTKPAHIARTHARF
jgi:hypothetical protein